jgi:hypothetical protein
MFIVLGDDGCSPRQGVIWSCAVGNQHSAGVRRDVACGSINIALRWSAEDRLLNGSVWLVCELGRPRAASPTSDPVLAAAATAQQVVSCAASSSQQRANSCALSAAEKSADTSAYCGRRGDRQNGPARRADSITPSIVIVPLAGYAAVLIRAVIPLPNGGRIPAPSVPVASRRIGSYGKR